MEQDTESKSGMLGDDMDALRVDPSNGCAYSKADFVQVDVACIGEQVVILAAS